ncbi:MAG: DUF2184 domain-containing protein [Clostridiales bacterium]|nr:DUF2184 domain-containing protein [Clostridiales bacterium]
MSFQNVGTTTLDTNTLGKGGAMTMDAAGIASGQAFLVSELEKRDTLVRTPLTSFTYGRDLPIRVGGGWDEYVSAMSVNYGVTGGSGNLGHAAGANGIPMVQANFDKGIFKTHLISAGTRVMWVDMQRGNLTGRNMDTLLRDGLRLAYDKHLDQNAYVGFTDYGTTGLINSAEVTATTAATGAGGYTTFKTKTPDEILADINTAILDAWEASEYDLDAVPNHIIMPYEQFNYLATTKVSNLAEKTILTFLLENNVATANGSDLFIGATAWCKGAGTGSSDRMVVYCNKERYVAMDELVPLTRAMTSPNTADFCYDTAYAANVSEVEIFYSQTIAYVDGI